MSIFNYKFYFPSLSKVLYLCSISSGPDYGLFFLKKYLRNKGSKSFALTTLFLFLLLLLREVCSWDDALHTDADTGEPNSEVVLVTRTAVVPVPSQPLSHGACTSQKL